jgi:hypothetical protein
MHASTAACIARRAHEVVEWIQQRVQGQGQQAQQQDAGGGQEDEGANQPPGGGDGGPASGALQAAHAANAAHAAAAAAAARAAVTPLMVVNDHALRSKLKVRGRGGPGFLLREMEMGEDFLHNNFILGLGMCHMHGSAWVG